VEAQAELHASGITMCGGCHGTETLSYADYYHGAAYKKGAPDAPACWDCHATHKVLPSTDRNSTTNKDKIIDTCKKCHADPRDGYVDYAQLVHGKQQVQNSIPLYWTVQAAQDKFNELFHRVGK
jgi:hypothetical protein